MSDQAQQHSHEPDLIGLAVEAIDGHIGTVDGATGALGGSDLVVDTGRWTFKRRRIIPGGAVTSVEVDGETVRTSITRGQFKHARPYSDQTIDGPGFAGVDGGGSGF